MRLLFDLDGTLADWGERFDDILDTHYPMSLISRTADQQSFNLKQGLPEHEHQALQDVMNWPGFYADLKPMPGALDAFIDAANVGHDNWIVTTPTITNPSCAQDKYEWVEKHLGEFWAHRVILTFDKTLIKGDVLFDDRPDIHGVAIPEWKQILYTQPYNKASDLPRIDNWADWESVLDSVFTEATA